MGNEEYETKPIEYVKGGFGMYNEMYRKASEGEYNISELKKWQAETRIVMRLGLENGLHNSTLPLKLGRVRIQRQNA